MMQIDTVEIHTGDYARDYQRGTDWSHHLKDYLKLKKIIKDAGLGYHAGHGLTVNSLEPLLKERIFEEYNIGHWIVSESVFLGLGPVVKEMLMLIKKYPLEE
jgi:pyridoxine 5-phosphate synthase